MKTSLNAIDLFCGCGGLSYGFEKAGYNILLGIDNDAKALETFELNHKGSKSICGDITELTYEKDLDSLSEKCDKVIKAGEAYESFGGISDDMKGSVKFIIKTDSISK